jgi:hypothetical protein
MSCTLGWSTSTVALASRYCGLLQASLESDRQARRLDPNISTTVTHTYFAMGDFTPLRLGE